MHSAKIIGFLVAGMLFATAEIVSFTDPVTILLKECGVLGILVWYLWYVTSRDRPRVEKLHQEVIERIITTQKTVVDKLSADNKEAVTLLATQTKEAAAILADAHRVTVQNLSKEFSDECREQRIATEANVTHIIGQMEKQDASLLEVVRSCTSGRGILVHSVSAGEGRREEGK